MTTYDIFTRVSNAQDIAGETSAVSVNSVPLSVGSGPGGAAVLRDIGVGEPVAFRCHVTTAFSAGETLTVEVILASDSALTTSITAIGATAAITTGNLTAGTEFDVPVPPLTQAYLAANGKAYMGLRYLLSGALAASAISAWIPLGQSPSKPRRYAGNYTGP